MMSREEMQECMDCGLHNDTWFDKQDALRTRKEGWKVWAINLDTSEPYVYQRGFHTKEDAQAFIKAQGMAGSAFIKEAEMSDPDWFHDGEKGYYAQQYDDPDYRHDNYED